MTTDRQKKAIMFCNETLPDKFNGDINNFKEVSLYLSQHLAEAKKKSESKKVVLATTRHCDYCSYIGDDDLNNIEDPYWIIE